MACGHRAHCGKACGHCADCLSGFHRKASSSEPASEAHTEAASSQVGARGSQPSAALNSSGPPSRETLLHIMLRGKFTALVHALPMSELPVHIRLEIHRLGHIVKLRSLPRHEGLELLNSLVTPYDALAYLVRADLESCLWREIELLFHADPNVRFNSIAQALRIVFARFALAPRPESAPSMAESSLPTLVDSALDLLEESEDVLEEAAKTPDDRLSGELMAASSRLIDRVLEAENQIEEGPNPDEDEDDTPACPFLVGIAKQIAAGHLNSWPTSFTFPADLAGPNNPCPHLRSIAGPTDFGYGPSHSAHPPPGTIDLAFEPGVVHRVAFPFSSASTGPLSSAAPSQVQPNQIQQPRMPQSESPSNLPPTVEDNKDDEGET